MLEKPLLFNDVVMPISIPMQDSSVDGDVVLSGWGSIAPGGWSMPDILQKVTLQIVDFKTCKEAIESIAENAPIAPTNVCTGPLTGGVSPCNVRIICNRYYFYNYGNYIQHAHCLRGCFSIP